MKKNLLNKYYKGESTCEEEIKLKEEILAEKTHSSEKDIFEYFQREGDIPEDLEKNILSGFEEKLRKKLDIRIRLISFTSAAAVILIALSIYLDFRNVKQQKIEDNFFVMEQALFQVSKSIQPEEQDEMLVLWVDENVEIIIN